MDVSTGFSAHFCQSDHGRRMSSSHRKLAFLFRCEGGKVLKKHVLFKKSFENELGFQNKNYDNLTTHVLRLLVCMASGCALSAERWVRKADGQTDTN